MTPWPFETSSVDEVLMRHVLEHLGAQADVFLAIMKELYRVCAPNASIVVEVPHPRSNGYANDPTHVRPINDAILMLFSKKRNREWKELGWPNTPLATYLDVDFEIEALSYSLTAYWAQKYQSGEMSAAEIEFAKDTYFNVVDAITVHLRIVK